MGGLRTTRQGLGVKKSLRIFAALTVASAGLLVAAAHAGASSPAPPDAPSGVKASIGDKSLTVSWRKPVNPGSSPITSYAVALVPADGSCVSGAKPRSCSIYGLTNGREYAITVSAANEDAAGPSSIPPLAATPSAPPSAPQSVSARPLTSSAEVSWVKPGDQGGTPITSYQVVSSPAGGSCRTLPDIRHCLVGGLQNGTSYSFLVRAANEAGLGPAEETLLAVIPADMPSFPVSVRASPGDGAAYVSWDPPSVDGGSAITSYLVSASPGEMTCTSDEPAHWCELTGLTNGERYKIRVVARNAVALGQRSKAVTVTPHPVPSPPIGITALAGAESIAVSWVPSSNQPLGISVTSYLVSAWPGGSTCSTSDQSCTLTGLQDGTAYLVDVVAVAGKDRSWPLQASEPVRPVSKPGKPLLLGVDPGSRSVTPTWKEPIFDGGSPITNYVAVANPGLQQCTTQSHTCTIAGLDPAVPVRITVQAVNAIGVGEATAPSEPVTPAVAPGVPVDLAATARPESAVLSWNSPADDGGSDIISFKVKSFPPGGKCKTSGSERGCTITGLTDGVPYIFKASASNKLGTSALSLQSNAVTPATTPESPLSAKVKPGIGSLIVSFDPPNSDGGSPIIDYKVLATPGNIECITTSSPCQVTGLDPSVKYRVTVVARNLVGAGPSSESSNAAMPDVVTEISAGRGDGGAACAILRSGSTLCWGSNSSGQMSTGNSDPIGGSHAIPGLPPMESITVGPESVCAIDTTSRVWCWGSIAILGKAWGDRSFQPVTSTMGKGVKQIAIGSSGACVLYLQGGVACWGFNGSTQYSPLPMPVDGLGSGVRQISVGNGFACALLDAGGVMCWGDNTFGQLGDGTKNSSNAPVAVQRLTNVKSISLGGDAACAIYGGTTNVSQQHLACWGEGDFGQLGNGRLISISTPQGVPRMEGVASVSVGLDHACGVSTTNGLFCWGQNWAGQLGLGGIRSFGTPQSVANVGSSPLTNVDSGGYFSCAITGSGSPYCWGFNESGQTGQPLGADTSRPILVPIGGI